MNKLSCAVCVGLCVFYTRVIAALSVICIRCVDNSLSPSPLSSSSAPRFSSPPSSIIWLQRTHWVLKLSPLFVSNILLYILLYVYYLGKKDLKKCRNLGCQKESTFTCSYTVRSQIRLEMQRGFWQCVSPSLKAGLLKISRLTFELSPI